MVIVTATMTGEMKVQPGEVKGDGPVENWVASPHPTFPSLIVSLPILAYVYNQSIDITRRGEHTYREKKERKRIGDERVRAKSICWACVLWSRESHARQLAGVYAIIARANKVSLSFFRFLSLSISCPLWPRLYIYLYIVIEIDIYSTRLYTLFAARRSSRSLYVKTIFLYLLYSVD